MPTPEELAARFGWDAVNRVRAEMRRDWGALDAADYSDEAMDAFRLTPSGRALGAATAPKLRPEFVNEVWIDCKLIRRAQEWGG